MTSMGNWFVFAVDNSVTIVSFDATIQENSLRENHMKVSKAKFTRAGAAKALFIPPAAKTSREPILPDAAPCTDVHFSRCG